MFWFVVPAAAYLVPVVEVPTWCQWWRCLPGASGCLHGASGGGAYLVPVATYMVPVVEVPPWCRWLPGSSPAYSQTDT